MLSVNANLIDEAQRYISNQLSHEPTRTRDWVHIIDAVSGQQTTPAEAAIFRRLREQLVQIPAERSAPLGCCTF